MATVEAIAADYQAQVTEVGQILAATLTRLWKRPGARSMFEPFVSLATGPSTVGFSTVLSEAIGAFTAAQFVVASLADGYVGEVLAAQGVALDPAGVVAAEAFAGVTASGMSLEQLLLLPAQRADRAISRGLDVRAAEARAVSQLQMYAASEVADAGRLSSATAGVSHRAGGYVRRLRPPSCSRCAILAGRWYKISDGFRRHPNCFPAGVVVSSPGLEAVAKRWYEGELVIVTAADGQEIPVTVNHPILTDRGWVPAGLIREGDNVVRSSLGPGSPAISVHMSRPDHNHVPSSIEDVWRANSMLPVVSVVGASHDFHGDGINGKVDIVRADGLLRDSGNLAVEEPSPEGPFMLGDETVVGIEGGAALPVDRAAHEIAHVSFGAERSLAGGLDSSRSSAVGSHECPGNPLLVGQATGPEGGRLFGSPGVDASLTEFLDECGMAHPIPGRQDRGALPGKVGGGGLRDGDLLDLTRWDAPAGPLSIDSGAAYAAYGLNLGNRLASQVKLHRVIHVRRTTFRGHVYNLTSTEGWYSANGFIVSNCDCTHVPASRAYAEDNNLVYDPRAAIEAGQVTGLSKAEAQAILLGANPSQVVNSRDGMFVAGDGRQYTTTGTTRRGVAGARLIAQQIAKSQGATPGGVYRNFTVSRREIAAYEARYGAVFRSGTTFQRRAPLGGVQTVTTRVSRAPRASVAEILRSSTSIEDARRVLINQGYIL